MGGRATDAQNTVFHKEAHAMEYRNDQQNRNSNDQNYQNKKNDQNVQNKKNDQNAQNKKNEQNRNNQQNYR